MEATTWKIMSECDNNIKTNLQEIEREGVNWINSAHDTDNWKVLVKAKK
jgi:hypothetical protein